MTVLFEPNSLLDEDAARGGRYMQPELTDNSAFVHVTGQVANICTIKGVISQLHRTSI